jgi:hypothetical protein
MERPVLLSPKEAAEVFGCSLNHLRTLPIPTLRLGRLVRYRLEDVTEFINASVRPD